MGLFVVRWLGFGAIYLMTGAVVFRTILLPRVIGAGVTVGAFGTRVNQLGVWASGLWTATTLGRGYLQLRTFSEPGEPLTRSAVATILLHSGWGQAWMTQLVIAGAAVPLWLASRRSGPLLAIIATIPVLVTAPLTGHASSEAAGRFGWVWDTLHLMAGSAWLGTLAAIALLGLPALAQAAPDERRVATLIGAFSPIALGGAAVVVLAGAFMGYRYLGYDLSAFTTTPYGRALGLKLVALAGVAAAGAYNWRILKPRLGSGRAVHHLRRAIRIELGLGLLLLAITAVLVALPMPAESQ